jgi:hypothetical protein
MMLPTKQHRNLLGHPAHAPEAGSDFAAGEPELV